MGTTPAIRRSLFVVQLSEAGGGRTWNIYLSINQYRRIPQPFFEVLWVELLRVGDIEPIHNSYTSTQYHPIVVSRTLLPVGGYWLAKKIIFLSIEVSKQVYSSAMGVKC